MDAGIIAKIKGKLRKFYSSWVTGLTREQIGKRVKAEEIKIPADVPTCKKNLCIWLSEIVNLINQDKSGIVHCWEETQLLRAWERKVQVDAASKAKELFPNLADADMELTTEIIGRLLDEPGAEDPEAGYDGVPFTQTENEDEFL